MGLSREDTFGIRPDLFEALGQVMPNKQMVEQAAQSGRDGARAALDAAKAAREVAEKADLSSEEGRQLAIEAHSAAIEANTLAIETNAYAISMLEQKLSVGGSADVDKKQASTEMFSIEIEDTNVPTWVKVRTLGEWVGTLMVWVWHSSSSTVVPGHMTQRALQVSAEQREFRIDRRDYRYWIDSCSALAIRQPGKAKTKKFGPVGSVANRWKSNPLFRFVAPKDGTYWTRWDANFDDLWSVGGKQHVELRVNGAVVARLTRDMPFLVQRVRGDRSAKVELKRGDEVTLWCGGIFYDDVKAGKRFRDVWLEVGWVE